MNPPDPSPVVDLIEAFRGSKTMFTALALGIFDRLHQRPSTASALAGELNADVSAIERLLDASAALGLLVKRQDRYANHPVADAYLWSGSPYSLSGYIEYSDQALYPMWGHLADAVREGSHRWTQTFGLEGPLFNHFFRTPEAQRAFLRGMHGFGMLSSPRVVTAFDLSRFTTLADLGGATGHLTIAACERYPGLRGIVFELPGPAAMAREQVALSSARERIQVLEGDFFEDGLPPADLYAVGRILHDWTEEKIGRLLRKIVAALPPEGGLLVAEKLLNEDGVGPLPANLQSLNMLICAEGRERSLGEYTRLLRDAGFASVEGWRTGAPLDAILATRG
ncbi:MAG TPA: class I SAM-dependent methyltransferase [Bryobacteraceae bacterium]|nr:class I SAM-dependent methyltransferase [Bryobacteraceae bacterium]